MGTFDENGNLVDPTTYTGATYDIFGNAVSTPASGDSQAANYGATYTALTTSPVASTTTSPASSSGWLTSTLGAITSLAGTGASIYSAASGKPATAVASPTAANPAAPAAKAASSSTTTYLMFGIVALLGAWFFIRRSRGK
jgi:hypothetical protein